MSRFRDSLEDDGSDSAIDISPLIDCVFILLIFFIVTTVFVEETGVDVEKPQAAASTDLPSQSILIAITPEGGVVYDERDITVNGVGPLIQRLTAKETLPVIITADVNAKAGLMTQVIGEAKAAREGIVVNIAAKLPER